MQAGVAISPSESVNKQTPDKNIAFRWTYIALPAAVFLIAIVLAASFYGSLPPDVAYHFEDGSPDRWLRTRVRSRSPAAARARVTHSSLERWPPRPEIRRFNS